MRPLQTSKEPIAIVRAVFGDRFDKIGDQLTGLDNKIMGVDRWAYRVMSIGASTQKQCAATTLKFPAV
jgi:hypothetical protein